MKNSKTKEYATEFVTNAKGKWVSVIMPIENYQNLQEDLQDLALLAERKQGEFISYQEFRKTLNDLRLLVSPLQG